MATLKWKSSDGWIEFFKEVAGNVLYATKNLADLTDRQEALKNLGLTGDVTTHNHNSLYNAKFDKLNNELSNKIAALSTKIDNIQNNYTTKETNIQTQLDAINKLIANKMDNTRIIISETEPKDKHAGDVWFCTKNGSRLISTWNGSSWEHYSAVWE